MTVVPGMVWDACTMLNLVATDRAAEILTALGSPSYIVRQVREGEVFRLRPLPEEDPTGALVPVDLLPLIMAGALHEIEMTPDEEATFVSFAAQVDDGEARSSAVAVHRGLTLVTDDRACIRLVQALSPPLAVITTIDWVKQWVYARSIDDAALSAVLRRIEICAHYRPRRNHPLKPWWDGYILATPTKVNAGDETTI